MTYYILKSDNPNDPLDLGTPTRIRLIGPFDTEKAAGEWGADPANNPFDNPCWQVVNLEAEPLTIKLPLGDLVYYPLDVVTPDKAATQASEREQAYITATGKTPMDALRERHNKLRFNLNADAAIEVRLRAAGITPYQQ